MKRLLSVLTAVLWMCVTPTSHAAPLYNLTVVGLADGEGYDVNSQDQMVGAFAFGDGRHAFLYDGIGFNDLGTLGGANSVAWHLNDSGTVVGTSDTQTTAQGFIYSGGVMTGIAGTGSANEINNAGVVTGRAYFDNGMEDPLGRATYANGVLTNLGTLPGADAWGSEGKAINNAGQVAGTAEVEGSPGYPTQLFLYSNGVMQDLGNFGNIYSNAWGINDLGQVVGSVGVPSNDFPYVWHAFLYSDGVMQDLGAVIDGGLGSAYDINNKGEAVGRADTADGARGVLYANGAITLLESLIDPLSGWTIENANGVNDLHQIAATGCKLGICYAVRLDLAPVPEPGQVLLLAGGIALLTLRGAARKAPGLSRQTGLRLSASWLERVPNEHPRSAGMFDQSNAASAFVVKRQHQCISAGHVVPGISAVRVPSAAAVVVAQLTGTASRWISLRVPTLPVSVSPTLVMPISLLPNAPSRSSAPS